jgi:hypothetical protein
MRKSKNSIKILKANEHATHVYKLQIYQMTHTHKKNTKSRETIPLKGIQVQTGIEMLYTTYTVFLVEFFF